MYTVPKIQEWSPPSLYRALSEVKGARWAEGEQVRSEGDLKALRDRWVARKNGILTQINELWLKAAPADKKRDIGQRVNEIRKFVETTLEQIQRNSSKSGALLE